MSKIRSCTESNAAKRVMLKCGCAAQGVCSAMGSVKFDPPVPSCVVHECIEQVDAPTLSGRLAKCGCGNTRQSDLDLAFFEYLGPGSPAAAKTCKHCRYHEVAHEKPLPKHLEKQCGHDFEPHGPFEFDRFYCGCRGWD